MNSYEEGFSVHRT